MNTIQADDQSFADLMKACDYHFKRSRSEEETKSSDHRRPRNGQRRHSCSSGSVDDSLLIIITRFKSIEFRLHLFVLHSGRQKFDFAPDVSVFTGLAWPERTGNSHPTTTSANVSGGVRRTSEPCGQAPNRIKRPRIDPCIEVQTNLDPNQYMELLAMGPSKQDSETHRQGTYFLGGCIQDNPAHSSTCQSAGADSALLGAQADTDRSDRSGAMW